MQKNHRPGQQEKEGCPVPQGRRAETYIVMPCYAYIIVYKLTRAAGEGRMSRSTGGGGGGKHISLCLYNCM